MVSYYTNVYVCTGLEKNYIVYIFCRNGKRLNGESLYCKNDV